MTGERLVLLRRDARNRALRVFLVGLAIDLAVAVALLVQEAFADDDVDYRVLLASLVRTAVQTTAAYVLRRFLDPSRLRTPLPPGDPGEPDADVEPGLPPVVDGDYGDSRP